MAAGRLQRRRGRFRARRASFGGNALRPRRPVRLAGLRAPVKLTVARQCCDVWPSWAGQHGSGGVGCGTGGVSPSGWGGPYEDAGFGLLECPAVSLLASVVPSAERAEIALTRPAARLVGNGVILIALRCRAPATGRGAAGRPGFDQMPQQPAWLVARLLVAVLTCAHGQRGDPDPESLEERSGQRVQRIKLLSRDCPPVCRPIRVWPIAARAVSRRSLPCRIMRPRAVRGGLMWSRAVGRWVIPCWPILVWAVRPSGRVAGLIGRVAGPIGRLLWCGTPAAGASVPDGLAVLAYYRYAPPGRRVRSGRPGQLRVDRPECRHLTWCV